MKRLKNFWKTFFCGDRLKNFCEDLSFFFFFGDRLKNFCEDLFFFGEHLRLCPWSLALASSIPVLGLESVCPRKGCPWPRIFFVSLALASSLVSSTPPLLISSIVHGNFRTPPALINSSLRSRSETMNFSFITYPLPCKSCLLIENPRSR